MLVGTRNTSRGSTDGLTSHPVSVTPTPPTSGFVQDEAFRFQLFWNDLECRIPGARCVTVCGVPLQLCAHSWNDFVHDIVTFHSQGAGRSSEVERSLMVRWVVGSILHGVDPLSYLSFQPVLNDWCNTCRGMCYPVCGMVHIK